MTKNKMFVEKYTNRKLNGSRIEASIQQMKTISFLISFRARFALCAQVAVKKRDQISFYLFLYLLRVHFYLFHLGNCMHSWRATLHSSVYRDRAATSAVTAVAVAGVGLQSSPIDIEILSPIGFPSRIYIDRFNDSLRRGTLIRGHVDDNETGATMLRLIVTYTFRAPHHFWWRLPQNRARRNRRGGSDSLPLYFCCLFARSRFCPLSFSLFLSACLHMYSLV